MTATDYAALMQRQDVTDAIRGLIAAWDAERVALAEARSSDIDAATKVRDAYIERLATIWHEGPAYVEYYDDGTDRIADTAPKFALDRLEGGAWAVAWMGNRLIVVPNLAARQWEVSVIVGWRQAPSEIVPGVTVEEPVNEVHGFKTLQSALGFACSWLAEARGKRAGHP